MLTTARRIKMSRHVRPSAAWRAGVEREWLFQQFHRWRQAMTSIRDAIVCELVIRNSQHLKYLT